MKKIFTFSLSLFIYLGLQAQDVTEGKTIPTSYDRNSITVLFVDFSSGNYWNMAKQYIDSVVFSDKYDNNNLESLFIKPSFLRNSLSNDNMKEALLSEIANMSASKKIISKWYNRKPDGTMDMELVHHRGRFTATDADFFRAQTTRRGNAALEDYGNRLVNLSHLLLIDIEEINTAAEAGFDMKGWQAVVTSYLYKIDFNDEVRNAFYDTWIYDDDTEDIKAQKREAFSQLKIPIVPVTEVSLRVNSMQPHSDTGLGLFIKPKSNEQLMHELIQKCYDETLYRIEMEVPGFQVITAVYKTRPIRAKIGLKEGLKTDNRFFVYEYVYNPKTQKAEPKRRGVVRARSKSKIVDNRYEAMGEMEASQFYQVHGRRIREGYALQQQNDFGLEITVGGEAGNTGGFLGRADYRLGRFVGIQALFAYLEGGINIKEYASPGYSLETYAFLRGGAGIAKGFQLMRNLELRPYTGVGVEGTNHDIANDDFISSLYFRAGGNIALNVTHNFQLVGGAGIYQFLGYATDSDGNSWNETWDDLFPDRSGASVFIGLKYGF